MIWFGFRFIGAAKSGYEPRLGVCSADSHFRVAAITTAAVVTFAATVDVAASFLCAVIVSSSTNSRIGNGFAFAAAVRIMIFRALINCRVTVNMSFEVRARVAESRKVFCCAYRLRANRKTTGDEI